MSLRLVALILFIIMLPVELVFGAGGGVITSLSASGGANPGEIITISVSLRADGKINNSNLYFTIVTPTGVTVDTHSVEPPSMDAGHTWSYSWSSNNSGYPDIGNYTVNVCWSNGNSGGCQIASASTTFYSADSLGPFLLVGLTLVGLMIWKQRYKFVS